MAKRYLWTDKEVKGWARKYMVKRATLNSLEASIGVAHSTLWWCFTHRLEDIDLDLYDRVMIKLEANRHIGGRRA